MVRLEKGELFLRWLLMLLIDSLRSNILLGEFRLEDLFKYSFTSWEGVIAMVHFGAKKTKKKFLHACQLVDMIKMFI